MSESEAVVWINTHGMHSLSSCKYCTPGINMLDRAREPLHLGTMCGAGWGHLHALIAPQPHRQLHDDLRSPISVVPCTGNSDAWH
jgi:hypothetical protein